VRKLEKNVVVEEIDQMDGAIGASYCDHIDDWALYNRLNCAGQCEAVDALHLNDVPELHRASTIEQHFVYVSDRMDQ